MILVMETISLAEAKANLSRVVNDAATVHQRTTITKNGKPVAVILAVEDWESVLETLDVLSDPRAMTAIREAEDPDTEWVPEEEVRALVAERHAREDSSSIAS